MSTQKLRCREIAETDLDAVADLLTRGFVGRSRDYWMQGLRRQAEREVPNGYPRFGYMLDNGGAAAGLTGIFSRARGRKYFKGPHRPRLADLTDTELVLYGP